MAVKAGSIISSAQKKSTSTNNSYKSQSGAISSSTKKSADSIANSAKSASDKKTSSAQTSANKYATGAKNTDNSLINGYNSKSNGIMNSTQKQNSGLVNKYYNSDAYNNAQNLQNMGLDDWAKKNGIDISQNYADNQADTAAQAQRNVLDSQSRQNASENQNALNQIQNTYNTAGRSMDQNYFNQFSGSNQSNADRGLNAGIAAAQNMQLGMNKQRDMGNLFDTKMADTSQENNRFANQNQDISNNLSQVERQKSLDAQNIRQNMLTTSAGLLNNDRTSANNWANSNWNMTDSQMNNNNTMMGNKLNTLGNSTNMGISNANNYASNMTNNVNNATDRYLSNINNQSNAKLDNVNNYANSRQNTLNNYTNNSLSNLSDYTKMNVNDIYNNQQLAQQAANRASSERIARTNASAMKSAAAASRYVPSSAQSPLAGYSGAIKAQDSPGGSYNTGLDKYAQSQMKKSGVRAVVTSKSPLVHKYFPNPGGATTTKKGHPVNVYDPTTIAGNPNLSDWERMKLMGG